MMMMMTSRRSNVINERDDESIYLWPAASHLFVLWPKEFPNRLIVNHYSFLFFLFEKFDPLDEFHYFSLRKRKKMCRGFFSFFKKMAPFCNGLLNWFIFFCVCHLAQMRRGCRPTLA
jgi:hypothetical protein